MSATAVATIPYDNEFTAKVQSEYLSATASPTGSSKFYAHNLLSCLSKLDVLYPAFAIGGGGIVLELTLAQPQEVLTNCSSIGTQPSYDIQAVEIIAPVIQYPDSVVQSFKQMVQAQGSVSMSSVSYQSFVYPIPGSASPQTVSIPIALRSRSLKAVYFFFQPNSSSTDFSYPRTSARESPTAMSYYLRVGSQYFPASNIQYSTAGGPGGLTEAVIELEKSVSKLTDIRHGSVLSATNFALPQVRGGTAIFGIDLEASAISFLENGINTADNALSCYLEISNLTGLVAGNVQIYALFDNTISVMANGNLLVTK
jgi:hypothetical protein